MKNPKVTIAIPTRNRSKLLKRAIQFVLKQTYENYELIIVDNASTDNTKKVVKSFKDRRIHYQKNKKNLGIIKNWNKCIKYARGKYLNIFHDDDVIYPTFIEEAVLALDANPSVGFTFPLNKRVDINRKFLNTWWADYNKRSGLISGLDYILMTIEKERCISLAPSMVFRKNVFDKVGNFKQVYGYNTFDFNMWFLIALHYDVYYINKTLFEYTIHVDQMSQRHWRTSKSPTGAIGMMIEIIDAIARLMQLRYATKPKNRKFLSEKLIKIDKKITRYITTVVPDI